MFIFSLIAMKYLAFAMKAEIMILGLLMMYFNPMISSAPFMSGLALFTIGLYLALQGYFGTNFSGCIFGSAPVSKKKGFFG